MTKLFTVLALTFASVARADFAKLDDVSDLASAPGAAAYETGRAALVALQISMEGCSATAISSDGYVLTALHCLESCGSAVKKTRAGNGYLLSADLDKIQSGKATCSMTIVGDKKSHGGKARVIAAGAGYFAGVIAAPSDDYGSDSGSPPDVKAFSLKKVSQPVHIDEDYVILKFDQNLARGCVKANPDLTVGERIWTIGYPAATEGRAHNAPGSELRYTDGAVTSVSSAVMSTMDVVPGISGSGELNYNGELVAMSRGLQANPSDPKGSAAVASILSRPAPGTASAVPIAHILSDLTARYGSDVVKQAFNCY